MICPTCKNEFDPNARAAANPHPQYANPRSYIYCSQKCARKKRSQKYYATHRNAVIARIKRNKKN